MSTNTNQPDYNQKIQELKAKYPDAQIDWNYEHNVSICERSKTVIEPLISEEFFLSYENDFEHPTVTSNKPKYLIFDFDGVLADTSEANLGFWARELTGGDRAEAKILRDAYFDSPRHGKNHDLTDEQLAESRKNSLASCEYVIQTGFEMFEEFLEEIEKIPNAKLAIVSSGSRELIIWPKIREHRLSFTHVLGMEDHYSKEEKIALVCKDWGISPKDAYYFTDTRSDVVELRDYMDPTKIIGCPWGWVPADRLYDVLPDHQVLKNFEDIHRIFSRTNLKQLSLKGIEETKFYPADFQERGKNFIQNIRDWCISRDLTWGHKMPVWYNLDTNPDRKFYSYDEWLRNPIVRGEFSISETKPEFAGNWVQEEKILDTWFSSSLWPLSTLEFTETAQPKKQAVIIHGGNYYASREDYLESLREQEIDIREQRRDWKSGLIKKLEAEGFEVFTPQMPGKLNATYEEWEIWFKKVVDQLDPSGDLYLIGNSLGGNFLLKYLSKHTLKVKQLHLVAACSDAGDFAVGQEVSSISDNCRQIFIYHSKEDPVVLLSDAEKISTWLPKAKLSIFEGRGHFRISDFPEIEENILLKNYLYHWSSYRDLSLTFSDRLAAHGIIYNPKTRKFLIAKMNRERIKNLSMDVSYHPIGGKIEQGETAMQGFLREVEEETGLKPENIYNLQYMGKLFHGFTLELGGYARNIRLYSEMFYAETDLEIEGFKDSDQESAWISSEEIRGKILPGFEWALDFALQNSLPIYQTEEIINPEFATKDILAAHGVIYNPSLNKVLIIQINRSEQSFVFPGGGIYNLENIQSGWLREVEEESGLTVDDLQVIKPIVKTKISFSVASKQNNYLINGISFYAETMKEELKSGAEGEAKWVSVEELKTSWKSFYPELQPFYTWFLNNYNQPQNNTFNLQKKTDFEEFYPTQTMVTAKEIFYLWIVRMITLGKYFTGKIPFENLVITPTILDEKGRKMSKSLKNGLEPGQAISKFSSDSLRMSMMGGMIPGRNMRFGGALADRLMEGYRNFGNKVWNIARFLENKMASTEEQVETTELSAASFWILKKYLDLQDELSVNLENYELAHSVDVLYDFIWNNFADWYIEYLKTDSSQLEFAKKLFKQFVVTLSPYLPFESEILWKEFFGETDLLAFEVNDNTWLEDLWKENTANSELSQEFETVVNFIQTLRSTRGLFAIDPVKPIQVYSTSELLQKYSRFIQIMARSELIAEDRNGLYTVKKEQFSYALDILQYIVDKQTEIGRTEKIILDLNKQIEALQKQLSNNNFVQNAEPEVVEEKRRDLAQRFSEIEEQKAKLTFLT